MRPSRYRREDPRHCCFDAIEIDESLFFRDLLMDPKQPIGRTPDPRSRSMANCPAHVLSPHGCAEERKIFSTNIGANRWSASRVASAPSDAPVRGIVRPLPGIGRRTQRTGAYKLSISPRSFYPSGRGNGMPSCRPPITSSACRLALPAEVEKRVTHPRRRQRRRRRPRDRLRCGHRHSRCRRCRYRC